MTEDNGNTDIQRASAQRTAGLNYGNRGPVITSMEDMWRLAKGVVAGGFAPKGLHTPEAVLAAMTMGAELGISPMASLRGIAVINGRPSVYGDLAMALVQNSGLLEYCKELVEGEGDKRSADCEVKRAGRPHPVRRQFSVADAKRAGLWAKEGPWRLYPDRMLQMRARGYALRDEFADVLQGMYLAEESQDIVDSAPQDDRPRVERVLDKIKELPDSVPPVQQPAELLTVVSASAPVAPSVEQAAGLGDTEFVPKVWRHLEDAVIGLAKERGYPASAAKGPLFKQLTALKMKSEQVPTSEVAAAWKLAQEARGFFAGLAVKKIEPPQELPDRDPALDDSIV